jgi:hypothetical protein
MANEYRIPNEKSVNANPLPKGITAQPNKLKIRAIIGAKKNRLLVECCGITVSFTTNLRASLKG